MAAKTPKTKTVKLANPIPYGDGKSLSEITLTKPDAGTLRGISIKRIAEMYTEELAALVPRISTPVLAEEHVYSMPSDDTLTLYQEVQDFFQ